MKAASEFLTPVTLELGGKSPCVVDKNCDLDVTARRITWGKFFNAGQTCIAVDHVFVDETLKEKLIERIKFFIQEFYGEDPKTSNSYSRIVNGRHTQRIASYLEGIDKSQVVLGGDIDVETKYISPTIVLSPPEKCKLMEEEIFGPILPIYGFTDISEVIKKIISRPKPLALYVFSNEKKIQNTFLKKTSSGGLVFNDVMVHSVIHSLPFGGVGPSGMGAYHGKTGFDTFSHKKAVVNKTTWFDLQIRYPPYDDNKLQKLKKLL